MYLYKITARQKIGETKIIVQRHYEW